VVRVLWSGSAEPEQALGAALAAAGVPGAATREVAPDMESVFAYLADLATGVAS
jgi:hypothetical protein